MKNWLNTVKPGNQSRRVEYIAYCLFFLGQNLLWYLGGESTVVELVEAGLVVWQEMCDFFNNLVVHLQ